MKFNRYQAMGIIGAGIRVGEIKPTMNEAAKAYFREFKNQHECTVKRVAVGFDGSVRNDPEFKAKRMTKVTA